MDETAASERRARRADWPVRKRQLLDTAAAPDASTATERLASMWELAVEAWLVSGRSLPVYERSECPVRKFGPGEPRPPSDGD